MDSDREEEIEAADQMPFDMDEVMKAKANNPGMFVSAWEADENDLLPWSKAEIRGEVALRDYPGAEGTFAWKSFDILAYTPLHGNHLCTSDPAKRFIVAAEHGDLAGLTDLLQQAGSPTGSLATREGRPISASCLLSAKDADGYTALHRAAYGGHLSAVKFLLNAGADTNSRTNDGWTALHSAAFWNQLVCVETLVFAGADVNALTNSKQTALHLSVSNNQGAETLLFLLSQPGIRVHSQRNQLGDTVADLILRNTPHSRLCHAFSEAATCLGSL